MNATPRETIDHLEIREWAERQGGKPQVFDNPAAGSDPVGLRIDFAEGQDDRFVPEGNPPRDVSWEEFFDLFEQLSLVFVYEDGREVADKSMLYQFARREG